MAAEDASNFIFPSTTTQRRLTVLTLRRIAVSGALILTAYALSPESTVPLTTSQASEVRGGVCYVDAPTPCPTVTNSSPCSDVACASMDGGLTWQCPAASDHTHEKRQRNSSFYNTAESPSGFTDRVTPPLRPIVHCLEQTQCENCTPYDAGPPGTGGIPCWSVRAVGGPADGSQERQSTR